MAEDVVTAQPAPTRNHRAEALRQARQRRYDTAFAGHTYEIVQEIHLPPGRVCRTLFGRHVRHAYILRDKATGERIVVSRRNLQIIHDEYSGVERLPDTRPQLVS